MLDLAFWTNRLREVEDIHAGDLGHENLPPAHPLDAVENEVDSLIEGNPEARHPRIGNGDHAVLALLQEHRHDAPPASDNIAVSRTAENRSALPRVRIAMHEKL